MLLAPPSAYAARERRPATTSILPLTRQGPLQPYAYDAETARNWESVSADEVWTTPGYFDAIGATLVAGSARAISGADGEFVLEHVPADFARSERAVVRIEAGGFVPLDWPLPRDLMPEAYGDLTISLETSR